MSTSRDALDLPPLDPAHGAANTLAEALKSGEQGDNITILDERLKERMAQELSPVTETPGVIPQDIPVTIEASQARQAAPILEVSSERDAVRLLILTRNTTVREFGSFAQRHMLELGKVFAEIHVIMLVEAGEEETVATVRLADNIWLYSTESEAWWRTPIDAYRIANEQIAFAGGFRADVIVAEDPFESGVAAYFIGRKHKRSFQIHLLEDIYDPSFEDRDEHNSMRMFVSRHVFNRTTCVRTFGEFVRASLLEEYPKLASCTEVLPTYYNLRAWRDTVPTFKLTERYPQIKFIMLHVSSMQVRSHTSEVVISVAGLLHRYPTIGLVIVGSGPLRAAIEKQVISLGIQNQVKFEPMTEDVISHMKSAHILIHLSEDSEEDYVVLQAATVRLPMVASVASIANSLFIDGESALLCQSTDTMQVGRRINLLLNENQTRTRLALNAQETVFERIEQDYAAYLRAYRESIERCIQTES